MTGLATSAATRFELTAAPDNNISSFDITGDWCFMGQPRTPDLITLLRSTLRQIQEEQNAGDAILWRLQHSILLTIAELEVARVNKSQMS